MHMRSSCILLACWLAGQQVSNVAGLLVTDDTRARIGRKATEANSGPIFGRSFALDAAAAKKCSFSVEVMDTRYTNLTEAKFLTKDQYWTVAAMLNLLYAKKNHLDFRAVRVIDQVQNVSIPWHKIWYMRSRIMDLLQQKGESECRYIMYLDSDAWFREIDAPIDEWIGEMGEKYSISTDVALIASKEEAISPRMEEKDRKSWVNGGVLIFKVSNDAVQLLEAVIRGGIAYDRVGEEARNSAEHRTVSEFNVFTDWPAEQGILTNLWNEKNTGGEMSHWNTTADDWLNLRAESKFETSKIAVIDMLEMNSPWGRLIQHQWGRGTVWRARELHMAMLRAGLTTEDELLDLSRDVMDHIVEWNGTDGLLVQCPQELQPPVGHRGSI